MDSVQKKKFSEAHDLIGDILNANRLLKGIQVAKKQIHARSELCEAPGDSSF
jgi:hypothetical protein